MLKKKNEILILYLPVALYQSRVSRSILHGVHEMQQEKEKGKKNPMFSPLQFSSFSCVLPSIPQCKAVTSDDELPHYSSSLVRFSAFVISQIDPRALAPTMLLFYSLRSSSVIQYIQQLCLQVRSSCGTSRHGSAPALDARLLTRERERRDKRPN